MKQFAPITLLLLGLLLPTTVTAQLQEELRIWGEAGGTALKYSVQNGTTTTPMGGGVGIAYLHPIAKNWGVSLGAEYQYYSNNLLLSTVESSYTTAAGSISPTLPPEADELLMRASCSRLREQQVAHYLNIPLMLHYQGDGASALYLAAGVKVGTPIKGSFAMKADTITTTGYFAYDNQLFTYLPEYGFATYADCSVEDGELDFGLNVQLAIEAGYRITLTPRLSLYTGAAIGCGLVPLLTPEQCINPLVAYNTDAPSEPLYHSILITQRDYLSQGYLTSAVRANSVTFKVALGFGL